MLSGFDSSLDSRLREAEEAEKELVRLQPVAEEAPKLRLEKAKVQKRQEREHAKNSAMRIVERSMHAATEKQTRVPDLLESAGRAVQTLYTVMKELDGYRREASESMAIVDRVDYEIEVEEGEEHEISLDRDPRGLAYALAARHGDVRVKELLEEMEPGFTFLRGCDLSEPLYRDVAKFVLQHAINTPEGEIAAMTENQPVTTNGRTQSSSGPAVQELEE
ncbi:MAG: hypothetical protein BZY68_00440 [SAR202 cluster bacterium MP-SAtl-SRR3965592-G2]|jgi:hypothetical protein|nr:MAG: hypothetical protein BZY68_00440 [SAR202 cluster bacterium MP-SAtl-SRR3965592-G2]HIM79324.1 hypothetical protein [Dehalococcoidia bacterium]